MVSTQAGWRRHAVAVVVGVVGLGVFWGSPSPAAATVLPATISSNLTLNKAGSPYTGGATLESGATLTIEPGVELKPETLVVNGTLKAEGTAEEPIVFKPSSKGFRWGGIFFKPGSGSSLLEHAELIEGGESGGAAIRVEGASPHITHSTLVESYIYGISVRHGGAPEIDHNTISYSGNSGIAYFEAAGNSGAIDIHDNALDHNGGSASIYVEVSGSAGENIVASTLGDNVLSKNSALEALFYNGGELPPDIGNNTLSENYGNTIDFGGTLAKSGSWSDHGGSISISNLEIEAGATLSVGPGVTFRGGKYSIDGTFNVEGTAEDPVVFERQSPVSQYRGLLFEPGSGASVIDHAEIVEAGYGGAEAAITIDESSPHITNSTIRNCAWALHVKHGGAPEIDHNAFTSNSFAVSYGEAAENAGAVDIHDNHFSHNAGSASIWVEASGSAGANVAGVSLGNNTFEENSTLEQIYFNGGEIPPDVGDNDLSDNDGEFLHVSGIWAESGVWAAHGPPVRIGNLELPAGKTLTVEPGTVFQGGTFKIDGSLKVEGTAEDPVIFKSQGGSSWRGLLFEPGSSGSVLEHAEVIRAGYSWEPAIVIDEASPHITHSTVRESTYYGIQVKHGGAPEIDHNTISQSGSLGIIYGEASGNPGAIDIHDNRLDHNGGGGIYVEISGSNGASVAATSLGGNTLRENASSQAIYYNGGELPADIDDNSLHANTGNQITLSGTLAGSGTWSDHGVPIVVGALTVPEGATLTAGPGLAFEGGTFTVDGTLQAEGSEDLPVVFQRQGSSSYRGLLFEPGSDASVLDHVEVIGGGYSWEPAISIDGASPTITNSTIRGSTYMGIDVHKGSPTIESNRFRSNWHGLYYEGEGTLAAPHNDWGCEGGPGSSGCDDTWHVEWKPLASISSPPRPCVAGSPQPGPNLHCLLDRYKPELVFDSQESYFSDSAAEIVENWGNESGLWEEEGFEPYENVLLDEDESSPGNELAKAGPRLNGAFHLDLAALGTKYPNEAESDDNDWIDERGDDEETYVEDAHALESYGGFKNRSYAMLFKGSSGKIWLQYWYWYYYNSLGVKGVGVHEGDWESVQIGLDSEYKPDVVILSEHDGQVKCDVEEEEIELNETGAPIVYLGRGSHANYAKPGVYYLPVVGYDHVNGEGGSVTPTVEDLGASPSWLSWEGHWGHSDPESPWPLSEGEATSPQGPAFHGAWTDPDGYAESADDCFANFDEEESKGEGARAARSAVPAPAISATDLEGRHPQVTYRVPGGHDGEWPKLILSVDEKGDGLLPSTKVIERLGAREETTLPYKVNPKRESAILASLVYQDGTRSPVVRRRLPPGSATSR